MRMSVRSATWHRLASGLIPVAFVAALPLIQWCSPSDDPADILCLVADGVTAASPSHAERACPAGCDERGSAEAACPFSRPTERAFCVGAAMGGPGVRPLAPPLSAPSPLLALLAEPPVPVASLLEAGRIEPASEARPPTSAHHRTPP